ncbi:two-component system response regulator CseB [Streptomyces sp. NRRL S-241]|uniref:two-component system response regulator CseB n=1 Tax=Streptomyces sp. NRRL S-241 TaxID=1463896 RepID=UPI0006906099|nr:two-component system response regulator CseB [Streptomyces sp. NRRL S-241]
MTEVTDRPVRRRLLLVEDDAVIRDTVRIALERYGFTTSVAADGLTGLELFREQQPDLLILDVMLPELDGVGLCRRVRETSTVPILMLSARGAAIDIVGGLEAGADDYVTKPVETAVLVARIRMLLRRAGFPSGGERPARSALLSFGDVTVDPDGLEVRRSGEVVPLTPTELKLMLQFAARPGTVLDRNLLLREVWDYGWDGDRRVVDLHVQRLRTKIGADRIETVRGFGYKLRRG